MPTHPSATLISQPNPSGPLQASMPLSTSHATLLITWLSARRRGPGHRRWKSSTTRGMAVVPSVVGRETHVCPGARRVPLACTAGGGHCGGRSRRHACRSRAQGNTTHRRQGPSTGRQRSPAAEPAHEAALPEPHGTPLLPVLLRPAHRAPLPRPASLPLLRLRPWRPILVCARTTCTTFQDRPEMCRQPHASKRGAQWLAAPRRWQGPGHLLTF